MSSGESGATAAPTLGERVAKVTESISGNAAAPQNPSDTMEAKAENQRDRGEVGGAAEGHMLNVEKEKAATTAVAIDSAAKPAAPGEGPTPSSTCPTEPISSSSSIVASATEAVKIKLSMDVGASTPIPPAPANVQADNQPSSTTAAIPTRPSTTLTPASLLSSNVPKPLLFEGWKFFVSGTVKEEVIS